MKPPAKRPQFLATEHSALQAARSALVVEGNGRTTSFLTTISAGMVALTLVFQISRLGGSFIVFGLVLIPILALVGLSTYVRMVQLDMADLVTPRRSIASAASTSTARRRSRPT